MLGEGDGADGNKGVGALLLERASTFLINATFLGGIEKDGSLPKNGLWPFL